MTVITDMPKDTSIGIDEKTWKRLNSRKGPGDSFESVINDALDELEEFQEENDDDREDDVDDDRPDRERADHGGGPTDEFDESRDGRDLRALADVETPPQPTREEFEEAALAAIEYLREEGGATKSEFQKSIHDDYTARYENERTWWRKVVKPALKAHPDIETPPKGASTWRFRQ